MGFLPRGALLIPELILVCAVVGVLAGLMGGALGLGGGVVIVPALLGVFYFMEFDPEVRVQMAVATSLATIVVTSVSAVRAHALRGNLRREIIVAMVPGVALGALGGAFIADWLPGETLARLFGVFAMLIALRMLFSGSAAGEDAGERVPGAAVMLPGAVVIGAVSSMFGIGGGSMTVPFMHWCRVRMQQAVAVSSACGLPIALAGCLGFVLAGWGRPELPAGSLGYIYLPAALAIVVTSYPAAHLAAGLVHRLPAAALRRTFAVVLFLVGLRLVL